MAATPCAGRPVSPAKPLSAFGGFFQGGQAEVRGIHSLDRGTATAGRLFRLAALFASCLILPFFKAREFFLSLLEFSI